MTFMKKYIHIAKAMKPTLTEEAREAISESYSRLRSFEREQAELARVCPDISILIATYLFLNV